MVYFAIGLLSLSLGILVGRHFSQSRQAGPDLMEVPVRVEEISNIPMCMQNLTRTYSGWQAVAGRLASSIGTATEEEEYKTYLLYCALMATGSRALAEAADESMRVYAKVREEIRGANQASQFPPG